MLIRQLFDPESSTYAYLVADRSAGAAALIDLARGMLSYSAAGLPVERT